MKRYSLVISAFLIFNIAGCSNSPSASSIKNAYEKKYAKAIDQGYLVINELKVTSDNVKNIMGQVVPKAAIIEMKVTFPKGNLCRNGFFNQPCVDIGPAGIGQRLESPGESRIIKDAVVIENGELLQVPGFGL